MAKGGLEFHSFKLTLDIIELMKKEAYAYLRVVSKKKVIRGSILFFYLFIEGFIKKKYGKP